MNVFARLDDGARVRVRLVAFAGRAVVCEDARGRRFVRPVDTLTVLWGVRE